MSSFNRRDNLSNLKGFTNSLDPQQNVIIGIIVPVYYFLLSAGGLPVRLLLRKNMGERAFSLFVFILAMLFYIAYGYVAHNIFLSESSYPLADAETGSSVNYWKTVLHNILVFLINPYVIFMAIITSKAVNHFGRIIKNARKNKYEYSYYRGDGIYFEHKKRKSFWGFKVTEPIIRMVYEPLGVLKICIPMIIICVGIIRLQNSLDFEAAYLSYIESIFSGLLITFVALTFSAIILFLDEFSITMRIRNYALSMLDGEIDMKKVTELKNKFVENSPVNTRDQRESDSISSAIID